MKLTTDDLHELAEIAVAAAGEAGRLVAEARPSVVEHKAGGASLASQVVTDVDLAAEALILDRLEPTLDRFDLALLSEEQADDGGRFAADHFWCIDPLDGTLAFVEGRPGYAVSIALVRRDGVPLIGVVHDPVDATTRHAVAGGGAFLDGRAWPAAVSADGEEVLAVFADRSLTAGDDGQVVIAALEELADDLGLAGIDVRIGAGAVMNACGVLDHRPACYLKLPSSTGGGSLWDFAATACLFGEVGAVAIDVAGAPLDLNRPDSTLMGHRGVCFATDAALAARLRALASTVRRPGP